MVAMRRTGRPHDRPVDPARRARLVYLRRRVTAVAVPAVVTVVLLLILDGQAPGSRAARTLGTGTGDTARSAPRSAISPPGGAGGGGFSSELLQNERVHYTSYIAAGSTRHREIALTFDDGPSAFTLPILAVLERYRVKATFFEIGRQVSADPGYTAALARAGMAIGDHTQSHPPMAELSSTQQAVEIDQAAQAIRAAGAPRPLVWRPPYGSFNATTLELLRAREMIMALWTVDTSDYARPGIPRIIYTALSGARPGAIILFHDGGDDRSQTVAALPRIIQRLQQRGYRLVTVPQLLLDDPPPTDQPPPHNLSGSG